MGALEASLFLGARREGNRIVVSMKGAGGVNVIASTCSVTCTSRSFFLTREHRKEDLVVVTVSGRGEHYNYFLPVRWAEEKPVELEPKELWLPRRQDCLPGIYNNHTLEAVYKGKLFTTGEYRADGPGKIFIDSPTLLCQFINGDVEFGALAIVARERVVERKATEKLVEAEKTIKQHEVNYDLRTQELKRTRDMLEKVLGYAGYLWYQIGNLEAQYKDRLLPFYAAKWVKEVQRTREQVKELLQKAEYLVRH